MRKILLPCLLVLSVLAFSLLTSCVEPVTPVAYLKIATTGDQVVYYSSDAYNSQMKVYKNQVEFEKEYGIADIVFQFRRCLSRDELNGEIYGIVDISQKPVYMTVSVNSDVFNPSKSFYLNGSKLVEDETDFTGDYIKIYHFDNLDLRRTNPHGKLDPDAVNVLEYR